MTDHIPSRFLAAPCATHVWIANKAKGGEPKFPHGRMVAGCCNCASYRWFTEKEWFAMNEAQDSNAE